MIFLQICGILIIQISLTWSSPRVRPDLTGRVAYYYSPLGLPDGFPYQEPLIHSEIGEDMLAEASSVVISKVRPEGPGSHYTEEDIHSRQNSLPPSGKPASLEGWLNKPTEAPEVIKADSAKTSTDKPGYCKSSIAYGIMCGKERNQCDEDLDCPGETKCCVVSDCGRLCVMPSDKPAKNRSSESTSKIENTESATTAEGLKMEDIADMESNSQKEASDAKKNV